GFSSFKRDTERLASTRARKVTIEEEEYVDPDLIAAEEERKRIEDELKVHLTAAKFLMGSLTESGVDVGEIENLILRSKKALKEEDYEGGLEYAEKAEELAKEMKTKLAAKEEKKCPECNEPIEEGWQICPNCRSRIGEKDEKEILDETISELKSSVASLKEKGIDTGNVENLIRLSSSFLKSKNYQKSSKYVEEAKKLLESIEKEHADK
ncbi:MAG: zinc ribbon domain-containing protein, partial [Candidatus Thermoplasmatota archaeon]